VNSAVVWWGFRKGKKAHKGLYDNDLSRRPDSLQRLGGGSLIKIGISREGEEERKSCETIRGQGDTKERKQTVHPLKKNTNKRPLPKRLRRKRTGGMRGGRETGARRNLVNRKKR